MEKGSFFVAGLEETVCEEVRKWQRRTKKKKKGVDLHL